MKKLLSIAFVLSLAAGWGLAQSDRATINAGALRTDLLSNNLMGDTTDAQYLPAGLFPYHDAKSLLKLGSLWVGGSIDNKKHFGVSAGYIDGNGIISSEWNDDGGLVSAAIPGAVSPLELSAGWSDTSNAANQGIKLGIKADLTVHQWSYSPIDKFYILNYKLENAGGEKVDSLYAGLYHLPTVFRDAANNSSNLDFCGFDSSSDPVNGGGRNLLWITADSFSCSNSYGVNPQFLGIRLLQAMDPSGSPAGLSGASSWFGLRMEPYSDDDPLNPYSKYFYLSRNRSDVADIQKVNAPVTTFDTLRLDFFGQVITDVEGVWDVNDTNHLGTNYYAGGSFDAEKGMIYLGTPKADRTALINSEEVWPSDTLTLTVSVIPVASVAGVYDNPLDTGVNYYTGGSFDPASGLITLGTPYYGGAQLYVDYYYRINNVAVSYNYYYNKVITTPWDSYTLQIDPYAVQNVEGVYWAKDSSGTGTNYYTGGSFDKSSGMISLAVPIDPDTLVFERYSTFMHDASWLPQDDTLDISELDLSKIVEILGVYDDSNTDRYPGGSYDPATGTITLGIPFSSDDYHSVWVTYRYLGLPSVWVKNYKPELSAKNVLTSVGPWTMDPGDTARAVFAVVAGNTLAELQAASDSALYIWNNPSAAISALAGSVSGMVERTAGRGPIPGAKVVAYQGVASLDSAYADDNGRYFISNISGGLYDSLVASAVNYLSASLSNVTVTNEQDNGGNNLTLISSRADLSGDIVRADGITPVKMAKIYIRGANSDSTFSDISGYYQFSGLEITAGDTLIFTAPYCRTDTVPGIMLAGDSASVINHTMHSLTGWIDGLITKLDGITPIAGATIKAARTADTVSAISGSDGHYSIPGLASDTYNILVSVDWFASDSMSGIGVVTDSTSLASLSLKQANNISSLIWQKKSTMPSWRYGSASAMAGGKVYLFGGRDYLGATNTVFCYDPAADTSRGDPWTSLTSMPTSRYGLGAATVGDSIIYVIGGYDNDSLPLATIEAYVPGSDAWVTGLAGMPTPRAFLGVASIADTVYAVGGLNEVFPGLDTVELYLPGSNSWVTKKALLGGPSFGRAGIGFATLDSLGTKRVHCIGGRKLDGSVLQTHIKYNPVTNAWASRAAIPWVVAFGAAASLNDSLYMIGGWDASNGYLNKVGAYTPFANTWSTATDLPITAAYHSASALDSVGLWIFGGKTADTYISDDIYFGYKAGGITGLCNTTTDGPVVGALVSAISDSKVKNTEATDNSGYYTLAGLEPGRYNVHIYKAGVMDTVISDVVVRWGRITDIGPVTGVSGGKPGVVVSSFALHPSYPNPARGFCHISYQIPSNSRVELAVYNVLGQKVKTLVSGNKPAGSYSIKWAGDDGRGQKVANGIYIYRLQMNSGTENKTATKKLVLLR
ncbi:MAG: carboxypeptidase regulatory-like domain-containing protein [Candidatus Edwardsbacteria bacterium]|nr:carboxypeptidase regulatory-like domain-containing protein [Candidatus Edwardsbacteria bacterium]